MWNSHPGFKNPPPHICQRGPFRVINQHHLECFWCLFITWSARKCCTKYCSFLAKSKPTISTVPSHGQESACTISATSILCFTHALNLTANKATVWFHSGMKSHAKHYPLLSVKSVSFSHHINCFLGHIFPSMGQILRLLSVKLLQTCKSTNILQAYRHTLGTWVANTINSQKSEDCDNTEKLCWILLVTTKIPRMHSQVFYFHTVKISIAYEQVIIISKFLV